jgi:hypothetical protein
MARSRLAIFVACAGILALSGCGGIHDRTEATVEVWNYCGESVTVAIGDGYDLRRDPQEFADFSHRLASGESTRMASLDTTGAFYVVAVGPDGTELMTRVGKSLGATLELRDDLCP